MAERAEPHRPGQGRTLLPGGLFGHSLRHAGYGQQDGQAVLSPHCGRLRSLHRHAPGLGEDPAAGQTPGTDRTGGAGLPGRARRPGQGHRPERRTAADAACRAGETTTSGGRFPEDRRIEAPEDAGDVRGHRGDHLRRAVPARGGTGGRRDSPHRQQPQGRAGRSRVAARARTAVQRRPLCHTPCHRVRADATRRLRCKQHLRHRPPAFVRGIHPVGANRWPRPAPDVA